MSTMVRFLYLYFTYSFKAIVCHTKFACTWFNMSLIQNVTNGTIDLQRAQTFCVFIKSASFNSRISLFCVTISILFYMSIL